MSYPCVHNGCRRDTDTPRSYCDTHARQTEAAPRGEAMTRRCSWCGRFGGRLVRYRLWLSTPVYERNLCHECEQSAASGPESWAVAVEAAP